MAKARQICYVIYETCAIISLFASVWLTSYSLIHWVTPITFLALGVLGIIIFGYEGDNKRVDHK